MRRDGNITLPDWSRRQLLVSAGLAALASVAPRPALAATARWSSDRKQRVIVVGAGIGGLATGALLAKRGHEVHVLERHPTAIGGHGRVHVIEGLRFGMGPQYVWSFGPGDWGDRFLHFLGIAEQNPFTPMNPDGFEVVVLGGGKQPVRFDVPIGLDRFEAALIARFPEERTNLGAFFGELGVIQRVVRRIVDGGMVGESRLGTNARIVTSPALSVSDKRLLYGLLPLSADDWFGRHALSRPVRQILYGNGGVFAEPVDEVSSLAFALVAGHYHMGAHYPERGFKTLFDSLAGVIESAGGSVRLGAEVTGLTREGTRLVSATCADGTVIPCDAVLSDIAPRLTAALIQGAEPSRYHYAPSPSILVLCLGFSKDANIASRLIGRNLWWIPADGRPDYLTADVSAPPTMIYAASPQMNGQEPGAEDLEGMLCFCPSNVEQEHAITVEGPDAVQRFADKLTADVVSTLERDALPGIQAELRFSRVYSSQDIIAEIASEHGAIYGRRANVASVQAGPPRPIEPVDNLTHVSAASHAAGIAAGVARAIAVLEELTGVVV